jgi:hypothetical protein
MLVLMRFRGVDRADLERAQSVLAAQKGCVEGRLGRNVDDPDLWVLETIWQGPGAYRRALSAYDVKVEAWGVLGQAVDEPTAYEIVTPGQPVNEEQPRG